MGALEFQNACGKAGIKSIGCQLNIAPLGIGERTPDMHQLVLLAMNRNGYRNLTELVSLGWIDGFFYEPRVDIDLIVNIKKTLFVSAALALTASSIATCKSVPKRKHNVKPNSPDIFGDRLYLELCDHQSGIDSNPDLVEISQALNIPLVATNWVHHQALMTPATTMCN